VEVPEETVFEEEQPEPVEALQESELVEEPPASEPEAEVVAKIEKAFPEVSFGTSVTEEILSAPSVSEKTIEEKSRAGTRIYGLAIPAWIAIAACIAVAVIGGIMYFGRSDEPRTLPPGDTEAAFTERTVPIPAPSVALQSEDSAAGTEQTVERPEPVPPAGEAGREPDPVPEKSNLPSPKKEAESVKPASPVKKETVSPPETRNEKPVRTEPKQAEPEPVVAEPVVTEPVVAGDTSEIVSDPDLAPVSDAGMAPVSEETEAVDIEPVAEPEPPEPAQLVRAFRGDLVPLNSVDTPPVQKVNVAPKYHPMARKLGQQGTVILDLLIDENGTVSDVKVIREIPKSTLNQMAVKAARQWVYEPAMKDGVPVKVWKQVSLDFRL
jgi:protein TonB